MQFVAEIEQPSVPERIGFVLVAILLHCAVLWASFLIPQTKQEVDGGRGAPVNVRVVEKAQPRVPVQTLARSPQKPLNSAMSRTAPRIPAPVVEVSPKPEVAPEANTSSIPSPPMSRLLPKPDSAFSENQRRVGAISGDDPAAAEELVPEGDTRAWRPNVVTTEFSTLAYRLDLERRFSDAWGGVRVLPPYSRFAGRTGELIVYNVVINRDGSLRRIVNLSALEQNERDFSAVDLLVQEFADSVFPLNPIPGRIREEPFVVRWSIRFMGFQYSFF